MGLVQRAERKPQRLFLVFQQIRLCAIPLLQTNTSPVAGPWQSSKVISPRVSNKRRIALSPPKKSHTFPRLNYTNLWLQCVPCFFNPTTSEASSNGA